MTEEELLAKDGPVGSRSLDDSDVPRVLPSYLQVLTMSTIDEQVNVSSSEISSRKKFSKVSGIPSAVSATGSAADVASMLSSPRAASMLSSPRAASMLSRTIWYQWIFLDKAGALLMIFGDLRDGCRATVSRRVNMYQAEPAYVYHPRPPDVHHLRPGGLHHPWSPDVHQSPDPVSRCQPSPPGTIGREVKNGATEREHYR